MLNGLYVKSPGIILHHVVVLICYISALVKTVGVPLLSLALVCELHSVFMHARKLLTMSNYSVRQSALLRWVWRTQWGSFVVARFAPHIVVAVLTYQGKNLFAHQVCSRCRLGMTFFFLTFAIVAVVAALPNGVQWDHLHQPAEHPCTSTHPRASHFSPTLVTNLVTLLTTGIIQLFFDVRKAYRKDCALPKAPLSPAPVTKAS